MLVPLGLEEVLGRQLETARQFASHLHRGRCLLGEVGGTHRSHTDGGVHANLGCATKAERRPDDGVAGDVHHGVDEEATEARVLRPAELPKCQLIEELATGDVLVLVAQAQFLQFIGEFSDVAVEDGVVHVTQARAHVGACDRITCSHQTAEDNLAQLLGEVHRRRSRHREHPTHALLAGEVSTPQLQVLVHILHRLLRVRCD